MKNKSRTFIAALCVFAMVLMPISSISDESDASQSWRMMLDEGNGSTEWFTIGAGGTYSDIIKNSLNSNGHDCTIVGDIITIDGNTECTIGSAKTSDNVLDVQGSSGVTVTSKWIAYRWLSDQNRWDPITDISAAYSQGNVAVGFYPSGTVPSETPDDLSVTCIGYDAESSKSQYADLTAGTSDTKWAEAGYDGKYEGVYSQILSAGGYAIIKYGSSNSSAPNTAMVVCKNVNTGDVKWYFKYTRTYFETSTSLIVGDYYYLQSSDGELFKIDWKNSSGDTTPVKTISEKIKSELPGYTTKGADYASGLTSMVCDSGAIYSMASNGMVYCFDLDLRPIWSYHTGGKGYFSPPVVYDDFVFAGMLDGHLYVLDKRTGVLIHDEKIYTMDNKGDEIGSVGVPTIVKDGSAYYIFVSFNDGRGMNSQTYGLALYKMTNNGTTWEKIKYVLDDYGATGSQTPYVSDSFKGVFFVGGNALYKMDIEGKCSALNSKVNSTHSYLALINGDRLIATSYSMGDPVCEYDLNGKLIGTYQNDESLDQFCLCPITVLNGLYIYGNDAGVMCVNGGFNSTETGTSSSQGLAGWQVLLIVIGVVAGLLIVAYCVMRFALKWDRPFHVLGSRFNTFIAGENYSHNTLRRHRLWIIMAIGITLSVIAAIASLCIGPTSTLSVGEMFSSLFSAIGKGGNDLTYNELMVYSARMPRTLVALAVGIGLSIAGAMYQAVIRNPLVDPYIMGVSSGAGTAAIAVIAFDFTFFGLFPSHSPYLSAITAMIGGIVAFFCTMVIANKAGGSSVSYVLAGVIVGLVFSAIQTIMLTFAGSKVTSALSWLYGSFAGITWDKVWLVVIPVIAISLSSLLWAKEFNLILLGEDQAKQMGLNVRKFNRWMLIIASILTSICVAFVGIIGFVGLVIPHLCRMMLGGDHRLVLPTSMAFGGFLMVIADLVARMIVPGFELPVGAITTIIGIPVFIWLLVKRGKMYDG